MNSHAPAIFEGVYPSEHSGELCRAKITFPDGACAYVFGDPEIAEERAKLIVMALNKIVCPGCGKSVDELKVEISGIGQRCCFQCAFPSDYYAFVDAQP